ncbi:DUF3035 domain-containing protein [Candidatus Pelagibacter sp.]|nr:DUF3035 domain-containing protein [Candidatus Pelagibacter sp.]
MKKIMTFITVLCLLTSCGSGLSLNNKKKGDEFLVEKKNPLVLPPSFGELPSPDDQVQSGDQNNSNSFEKILIKKDVEGLKKKTTANSLENSILEKIK